MQYTHPHLFLRLIRNRTVLTLAASALMFSAASHAGAAGLLVADGGFGGALEVKEHAVEVTINNGIAVTEVTQVFHNTENRIVEALYTFPVPKQASVSNFSMWIDGKEMIGEVLEKKRAREIYESYKQTRKDPGLLEQVDYKTFEMRIFPIPAGADQRVQITYYQELDFDNDWATYVYPLATVTRKDIKSRTTGRFAMTLHARSEIPIAEMKSPSHVEDFVIAQRGEDYVQASLETSGGDLNRDIVLAYRAVRPRTGIDLIASRAGNEDGTFCLTVTVGEELAELKQGMDYVFVIDISGSMANDGKLALSRGSVEAFVRSLSPEDRFELVAFNVSPSMLFQKLAPATPDAQALATAFLNSQSARGGTILKPALELAYRYGEPDRPLNVVILSDGLTEQAERTALLQSIAARPSNAKVFCIGVGNEINRPLLNQLASDAGGLAAFVSQGDDFERQAAAFRRKLTHPVASNLKLDFAGGGVYDLEPQRIPNLFHGTPVRVYGRYREAGPVKLTLSAEIDGKPITMGGDLEFPAKDDGSPEIERMWALHRIDRILGDADRTGSRQAVIDEVVRLGEGYSIVTEYTSFLVLENDAEYQRWKIERKNATRIERDRRKQQQVRETLTKLNEKTLASIAPDNAPARLIGPEVPLEDITPADLNVASAPIDPPRAARPVNVPTRSNNGIDLHLPSAGGGAGALDPITGGLALGLGALAWAQRRRRKK